jgi:hypothetical protein
MYPITYFRIGVELIWPTSTIFVTVLSSMDYFRVNASATEAFYSTVTDARSILVGVHSVADGAVAVMIAMHAAAANYSAFVLHRPPCVDEQDGIATTGRGSIGRPSELITGRLTYGSASVRRRRANGLGAMVFWGGF